MQTDWETINVLSYEIGCLEYEKRETTSTLWACALQARIDRMQSAINRLKSHLPLPQGVKMDVQSN